MSNFLWAASAMATLTFVVHTFIGGRVVARPLLADQNLPRASKWLNYYCWHIVTVVIAFIAAGFAWIAVRRAGAAHIEIPVALSSLTMMLSLLSAGVALKGGVHPLRFPSTSLFAATSILGWLAIAAG